MIPYGSMEVKSLCRLSFPGPVRRGSMSIGILQACQEHSLEELSIFMDSKFYQFQSIEAEAGTGPFNLC